MAASGDLNAAFREALAAFWKAEGWAAQPARLPFAQQGRAAARDFGLELFALVQSHGGYDEVRD